MSPMTFMKFTMLVVANFVLANGMAEDSTATMTCPNGLPGYNSSNNAAEYCCPLGCNSCGGVGCSNVGEEFGLGTSDCCQSGVFHSQVFCNESDSAPCIIESYIDDPDLYGVTVGINEEEEDAGENTQFCSNGLPGYSSANNAAEFCCPLGCNFCGGIGCGSSGIESGLIGLDCCQSGIFSTQVFCKENVTAPCIIESYLSDPSLYTTTMAQEDAGFSSSSSSSANKHGLSVVSALISGIIALAVSGFIFMKL